MATVIDSVRLRGLRPLADPRRSTCSYVQVPNTDGLLQLEYRDGSPHRHFQTMGASLVDAAEALGQWARGERTFIDRHDWTRLTMWDDEA